MANTLRASAALAAVTVLLAAAFLAPSAGAATLGAYGAIAGSSTTGLTGKLSAFASDGKILYQDSANAGVLDSTENVFLTVLSDSSADINDLQVTSSPGTQVVTPITGLADTTSTVALITMLRFKDSLPAMADGGPDGKFNPGETLFVDVDNLGALNANDILLAGGSGRQSSTDTDTTWHKASECLYVAAGATVAIADVRVSPCGAFTAGSVVATGNADIGTAVSAVAGSVYITGGDTAFAATEIAYISGDAAVGNGDVKVATFGDASSAGDLVDCVLSTGHAAGTPSGTTCAATLTALSNVKVSADAAVSYPAFAGSTVLPATCNPGGATQCTAAKILKFQDLNGDAAYGAGDRVYFDVDNNGYASPADVRLTTTGFTFGSRPALGDADTRAALSGSALASYKFLYLDGSTGTTGAIDTTEPIALDVDGNVHFDYGDLRLTDSGTCLAGSVRRGSDTCTETGTWKDASAASTTAALMKYDLAPTGLNLGDSMYLHIGPGTAVAVNDIRISAAYSGTTVSIAGGSRVASGAADIGRTIASLSNPDLRFFDVDGSRTRTQADHLYVDLQTASFADVGDLRMQRALNTFGQFMTEAESDTVLVLKDFGSTNFAFAQLHGSTRVLGDPIYLLVGRTTCTTFVAADVRTGPAPGSLAAGLSIGGSADIAYGCSVSGLTGTPFAYSPSTTSFSSSSLVYADLDGGATVTVGDIGISASGGRSPGGQVASGASDQNIGLTAITLGSACSARAITYIDVNGGGAFDNGDIAVLDMDSNCRYTAGDLLLTGTGGSTTVAGSTSTTVPPPPPASTTAPASTAPASTTAPPSSTTAPPSADTAFTRVEAANRALHASLTVTCDGDTNTVHWTAQTDVSGYQVWRADSPYAYVQLITDSSVTGYADSAGSATSTYLVTAYASAADGSLVGSVTDINTQGVPAGGELTGAQPCEAAGETTTEGGGSDERSPGLGLAALVAVLGAALWAARRRLR